VSEPLLPPNPESRTPNPVLFACLHAPRGSDGALLALAQAFSPRYERHGGDLIVLDVSGLERMFGHARAIGEAIRREALAQGCPAQVALAGTRTAALLLACACPGLRLVAPGGEAAALAGLPLALVSAAVLPPVAAPARERVAAAFKAWGVKTLGEVAALPAADLHARIGADGRMWQALARGDDVRPLVPEAAEERFDASLDLEWPIEGLEPLSFVLTRLLEPVTMRLERRDRAVAVLHVRLDLVAVPSPEVVTRTIQLPMPVRDVRTLRTLVLLDLEAHPLPAPVERVTLVVDPTPGKVLQHSLFERAHATPEQVSTLLARLGALMGQDRIGSPATLDTDHPGAFAMKMFAPAAMPSRGAADPRRGIGVSSRRGWGPGADEEAAPAAMPGRGAADPRRLGCALRRCRRPVPARVMLAGNRPVRVTTDRQGFVGGEVREAAGPWCASGEWWNAGTPSPHQSHPTHLPDLPWYDRIEWDVVLADGGVYSLFQDRTTGRWFVGGVMD
jgi:protein ImuB